MADAEAELAEKRYEYAIEQRDRLQERTRFGAITLNAASLLTIGSAVKSSALATQTELVPKALAGPAAIFALGLAAGALSIWVNGNHLTIRAGEAAAANSKAAGRRALFDSKISEHAEAQIATSLDEATKEASQPPPDFTYSAAAMQFANLSAALWLTGLGWTILKMLNWLG